MPSGPDKCCVAAGLGDYRRSYFSHGRRGRGTHPLLVVDFESSKIENVKCEYLLLNRRLLK